MVIVIYQLWDSWWLFFLSTQFIHHRIKLHPWRIFGMCSSSQATLPKMTGRSGDPKHRNIFPNQEVCSFSFPPRVSWTAKQWNSWSKCLFQPLALACFITALSIFWQAFAGHDLSFAIPFAFKSLKELTGILWIRVMNYHKTWHFWHLTRWTWKGNINKHRITKNFGRMVNAKILQISRTFGNELVDAGFSMHFLEATDKKKTCRIMGCSKCFIASPNQIKGMCCENVWIVKLLDMYVGVLSLKHGLQSYEKKQTFNTNIKPLPLNPTLWTHGSNNMIERVISAIWSIGNF